MENNKRKIYVIGHKNPDTDSDLFCDRLCRYQKQNGGKSRLRGKACRSDQRRNAVCAETFSDEYTGLYAECRYACQRHGCA